MPLYPAATSHVWIFDLDDTLHDATKYIFPFLHHSMNEYIQTHLSLDAEAAARLRRHYWAKYGATLTGLVRHHNTDPAHFLKATHTLPNPAGMIVRSPGLRDALQRLPGRKIVFSNSPRHYAELVLGQLGLKPHVHALYTIEDAGYHGKPDHRSFRALLSDARLNPRQCIMVEDSLINLRTAKRLGMKTVWVSTEKKSPCFVDARICSISKVAHIIRLLKPDRATL